MGKVRVVVVDDSDISRAMITDLLQRDGDIEVVGEGGDGREALAVVSELRPDVLTMDLSMPRVGGLEALGWIMSKTPVPVIIVTGEPMGSEAELAFEAMQQGAVDLIPKSAIRASGDKGALFRDRVREAAATPVFARARDEQTTMAPSTAERKRVNELVTDSQQPPVGIVGIAAGRGGSTAMTRIISRLSPDLPCAVILAQPVPSGYEVAYAEFLASSTEKRIALVGRDGAPLEAGVVYVAGADAHVVVIGKGKVALIDAPRERHARPSADHLFRSLAEVYGAGALGVVLSGRGEDGAAGLRAIKEAGGCTLIELPDSASADEMPGRARAHARRAVHLELLSDAIGALTSPLEEKTAPRSRADILGSNVIPRSKRRIYMLDDSVLLLETASAALEAAGYEVANACSLSELEELLAAGDPDLIITDVDMPEMYGHDVASVLRNVRNIQAPILLWSSFEKTDLAKAMREAPVDGYIPKSEGLAALLEGVRASFEGGH